MTIINQENILDLLYSYNTWWKTDTIQKEFVKTMRRFAYYEAYNFLMNIDIRRFIILCGARRVGKTTIMYQTIDELLKKGVSPKDILYISFDHPLLKLCSINTIIETYRSNISESKTIYCFFDEIQYASDWNSWLKILYDTNPNIKVMAASSASLALDDKIKESGLSRWKVINVPTLSFFEYCELLNIYVPELPSDIEPTQLHLLEKKKQQDIFHKFSGLQIHFIRYLQVGGFPESALSKYNLYVRENIAVKMFINDFPSIYGVRNMSDIEYIFLYLCYNSANIINLQTACEDLPGVSRSTIEKYISFLESANLIYISPLISLDGKTILKWQNKIYIADAAIRNSFMLWNDITNNPTQLGLVAEAAVFKHVKSFFRDDLPIIGYYRDSKRGKEIDIVVKSESFPPVMIEVKYREQVKISKTDAIVLESSEKRPNLIITKRHDDFGLCSYGDKCVYRIPAPAFLYLLGYVEKMRCNKQ